MPGSWTPHVLPYHKVTTARDDAGIHLGGANKHLEQYFAPLRHAGQAEQNGLEKCPEDGNWTNSTSEDLKRLGTF